MVAMDPLPSPLAVKGSVDCRFRFISSDHSPHTTLTPVHVPVPLQGLFLLPGNPSRFCPKTACFSTKPQLSY